MADSKSYLNQSQQTITVVTTNTVMAYIWYLAEIAVVEFVEASCFDDRDGITSILSKSSGYCQPCCSTCIVLAPPDRKLVLSDKYLLSRHSRTKR